MILCELKPHSHSLACLSIRDCDSVLAADCDERQPCGQRFLRPKTETSNRCIDGQGNSKGGLSTPGAATTAALPRADPAVATEAAPSLAVHLAQGPLDLCTQPGFHQEARGGKEEEQRGPERLRKPDLSVSRNSKPAMTSQGMGWGELIVRSVSSLLMPPLLSVSTFCNPPFPLPQPEGGSGGGAGGGR